MTEPPKLPSLTPALQHAIERAQQEDAGKRLLGKCVADLDQIQQMQRQVTTMAAHALALINGQAVMITALQVDTSTLRLTALDYRTADGGVHSLAIDRACATTARDRDTALTGAQKLSTVVHKSAMRTK